MSILVCGGAGYIGSHAVRRLLAAGYDVAVADNLSTGHREAVPASVRFYQGDLRDAAFLDAVFAAEQVQAVMHFAAFSLVGESVEQPLKYYNNNIGGTKSLLDAMVRHGVPYLVFSSTAAVYGEPQRLPIREEDATVPTNPYGESKLAAERMIAWVSKAHGIRSVRLRYFNACGADEAGDIGEAHEPETHLIPLVLQVPLGRRESIAVFGEDYDTPDGTCLRDYIHVCDLADAHILALRYLMAGGESDVFNLGNGIGYSVRHIIETARRVTGHPIPAVTMPRRAGDPAVLIASGDKARQLLGWQPKMDDPQAMVRSAWNWHRTHPHGY